MDKEISITMYNKSFEIVCIIDNFKSFIWTDRYQEAGDFELYIPPNSDAFKVAERGFYLYNPNSEHLMMIESIKTEVDIEEGTFATISGRSLEAILERRIIWNSTWYAGSIVDCIKLLLDSNIINPTDATRKIDNFEWGGCIGTEYQINHLSKYGVDIQLVGDNLYDTITKLCKTYNIGFKVTCDFSDNNKFKFYLYEGADRTENNHEDNMVIEFSPGNDNLVRSNYVEDDSSYKNVVMIGGQGEGDKQRFSSLYSDKYSNIDRRETYIDSTVALELDGHKLSTAEYERQLKEEGKKEIKDNKVNKAFEGEVQSGPSSMYQFRKDFFVGDIVLLKNEYNKSGYSIITESVESYDENGYSFTPTFVNIEIETVKIEGVAKTTSANQIFSFSGLENKALTIEWGDGNITISTGTSVEHTYEIAGSYDFTISYSNKSDMDFCPIFYNSTVLEKLDLPNGVKTIPENAFRGCTALAELNMPSSVTTIEGTNCFDGCSSLYSLVLPNSITNLGQDGKSTYFFNNCSNLVSVNFPYSSTIVASYFFNNCTKIRKIDFPGNTIADKGVTTINAYAMNGCKRLNNITFGSKVTKIEGNCTTGITKDLTIECMSTTPPTLTSTFSVASDKKVSSITVPTSPNYDDTVLNAYGNATNWNTYGIGDDGVIKEKDSKEEEDK